MAAGGGKLSPWLEQGEVAPSLMTSPGATCWVVAARMVVLSHRGVRVAVTRHSIAEKQIPPLPFAFVGMTNWCDILRLMAVKR